jgi:glycosyltransferase involved in cell wall biosynthesis
MSEVRATATRRTVSVVVPVYFNEESLGFLEEELQTVERSLDELGLSLELIFVDDGSRDQSLARLLAMKQRRPATKVVKLTRNFGAHRASKTGFRFVTGDCFLILAADLQDPPSLIVEASKRWLAGAKYVVCVRRGRSDARSTRFFAALFYRLLRFVAVPGFPAGGYDLALMDKQMLPLVRDSARNVNTPLFAYWLGFEPSVIEYVRQPRAHGRSRWGYRRRLTYLLDSILGFSIVPIRVISMLGLITALLSLAYGGLVAASALMGNRPVPGFATIVAILTFLISLVLLTLGVIAEYVWRIFDQVSDRPDAVIDEIY